MAKRKGYLKFAINFFNSIPAEHARNITLFSTVLHQFGRIITFKSEPQKQRFYIVKKISVNALVQKRQNLARQIWLV